MGKMEIFEIPNPSQKLLLSVIFFVFATLTTTTTIVECNPDVSDIQFPIQPPKRSYQQPPGNYPDPGFSNPDSLCGKVAHKTNECIEKIKNFEYRPFTSILEHRYQVPVPDIKYLELIQLKPRPIDVTIPKIVKKKVPVIHIKETPETATITRIKEVDIQVPVINTDVNTISKTLPNPQVTDEILRVPKIEKRPPVRKVVKRYRVTNKTIVIDTFKVEPKRTVIKRPILEKRIIYVNRTRVQYIPKIVEIPNVIVKTLRLPRPQIKKGDTIYREMNQVNKIPSRYEDEYPEQYEDYIQVDEVIREPKSIKIPYPEKTQVVQPVLIEAPIEIPEKQEIPVVRNIRVPGPKIRVPCGVPSGGAPYLPPPPQQCPTCPKSPCPTCHKCQMKGYNYQKPAGPIFFEN